MTEHHYMNVIASGAPKMIIIRTPWPMPKWRHIMRALTDVMHEHGLRQKDIHTVDGVVPSPDQDRDEEDVRFIARLDQAYDGDTSIVPRFWLYDWSGFKGGHFKLVREGA